MQLTHLFRRTATLAAAIAITAAVGCSGAQEREDAVAAEQSHFHYQLAIGHFQAREVPVAIQELLTSLEYDADNGDALFLLGFIYQGRLDYEEAERYYLEALRVMPDTPEIQNNLGTVYLEQERWEDAEETFRALTRIPTYISPGHAHNNLGWALYNQGYWSEALEQFELAVMFQPEHCVAYNNAGLVYAEHGRERDAVDAFETAIERCEEYVEPRYRLGVLLEQRPESMARAMSLFETCVELGPDTMYGRRCEEYLGTGGW